MINKSYIANNNLNLLLIANPVSHYEDTFSLNVQLTNKFPKASFYSFAVGSDPNEKSQFKKDLTNAWLSMMKDGNLLLKVKNPDLILFLDNTDYQEYINNTDKININNYKQLSIPNSHYILFEELIK